MLIAVKNFLNGLGVFLTALVDSWNKHQAKKRNEENIKNHNSIESDHASEWMRRFNSDAAHKDKTDKTPASKP